MAEKGGAKLDKMAKRWLKGGEGGSFFIISHETQKKGRSWRYL